MLISNIRIAETYTRRVKEKKYLVSLRYNLLNDKSVIYIHCVFSDLSTVTPLLNLLLVNHTYCGDLTTPISFCYSALPTQLSLQRTDGQA